jgi:tagatose-1,6-bisphosphate aldolase
MTHVAQQDAQVDALRSEMYEFKSDKENQILIGNNTCQKQREALDKLRKEVSAEEEKQDSLEDRKKDLSRELSEVSSSIKNMFTRCTSTVKSKQLFSNNRDASLLAEVLEYNLEIIMARVIDIKEIKKEFSAENR